VFQRTHGTLRRRNSAISKSACGSKDAVMIKTVFITAHRLSAADVAN
jgi:hypothetical protein